MWTMCLTTNTKQHQGRPQEKKRESFNKLHTLPTNFTKTEASLSTTAFMNRIPVCVIMADRPGRPSWLNVVSDFDAAPTRP
jgi:hypothetical protein